MWTYDPDNDMHVFWRKKKVNIFVYRSVQGDWIIDFLDPLVMNFAKTLNDALYTAQNL